MAGLKGGVRNLAFGRFGGSFDQLRSSHQAGPCEAGPADRHAKRAEKISAIDCGWLVHGLSPYVKFIVNSTNGSSIHNFALARERAEASSALCSALGKRFIDRGCTSSGQTVVHGCVD